MFLIRNSQTNSQSYAMDVLVKDDNTILCLKHFKIDQEVQQYEIPETCEYENINLFYISKFNKFTSVSELVEFYKSYNNLMEPINCPCPPIVVNLDYGFGVWELERDSIYYDTKDRLGGGNFGTVYRGDWITGGGYYNNIVPQKKTKVAVKVIKQRPESSSRRSTSHQNMSAVNQRIFDDFLKEATVMRSLRHPNLVKMEGVISVNDPYIIVMEYLQNGQLRKYLMDHGEYLPDRTLLNIICQIGSACAYLEKQFFVHRDIRASNVLIGRDINFSCKLGDFGLARCIKNSIDQQPLVKDPPWI